MRWGGRPLSHVAVAVVAVVDIQFYTRLWLGMPCGTCLLLATHLAAPLSDVLAHWATVTAIRSLLRAERDRRMTDHVYLEHAALEVECK